MVHLNFVQLKLSKPNLYFASPDIILMTLFSLSMKAWVLIAVWFLLAPIAQKYGAGPLYVSNSLEISCCNIYSIILRVCKLQ
jgi:hypothetical protein